MDRGILRYDENGNLTNVPPNGVVIAGLIAYGVAATFMALYILFNPICK